MQNLIEELDKVLQRAIHVPASGKILVDDAAVRQILEQMRTAVPDDIRLSQRIAGERERILADARAQAHRMVEEAQAQLNARLDDQATVQAARQRAHDIQVDAEGRAAILKADASKYVISQLNALEVRLQRLLREVQAGQRALTQETDGRSESSHQS